MIGAGLPAPLIFFRIYYKRSSTILKILWR
nr:MAG TPA: hypothetical protein [Caudoviricetes sp.]